jgi:hypothetical protein
LSGPARPPTPVFARYLSAGDHKYAIPGNFERPDGLRRARPV